MRIHLKQLKLELKEMASGIRASRQEYRTRQSRISHYANELGPKCYEWNTPERKLFRAFEDKPENIPWKAWTHSPHDFRLKHIAYCILRGRTYAQIEPKVHEANMLSKRDWEFINGIVSDITAKEASDVKPIA